MRFLGWHIDGFGSLSDWRVDGLGGGLNIFYGPNEAGKSTLLGFLRFVLFGFRGGNSREPRYPPPPGIRHGGRLYTLDESDDGVFCIERIANVSRGAKRLRIELPGGEEGSEADLGRLLGHADRELYTSVFAFSLSELQSIDTLTARGVQDHIFSAGITGAGRSAREALGQIQKESDELFKGRTNCRLNSLVEELAELDQKLQVQRERARGYPVLIRRESELAARHAALRGEVEANRRIAQRGRKLGETWVEIYRPLIEARESLAALPVAAPFGPEPRQRLDDAVAELDRCNASLASVREVLKRVDGALARLTQDPRALAVRDVVEALERDLGLYESQCKDLPSRRQLLAVQESSLGDGLTSLGPDWGADRLKEFHFSLANESEATRWGERLGQSDQELRDLQRNLRAEDNRLEGLRQRRDREASDHDTTESPESAGLEQRAADLRTLRTGQGQCSILEIQIDGKHELGAAERHTRGIARKSFAVLFVASTLALLWSLVGNGWRPSSEPWSVVSLALLALGTGGWVRYRGPSREGLAREAQMAGLERQLGEIRGRMSQVADELGLGAEVEPGDLDRVESQLADDRGVAARLFHQQTQIERAQAEIVQLSESLKTLNTGFLQATESHAALVSQWEAWRTRVGLPTDLSPRDVSVFAGGVQRAKDQLETVLQTATGLTDLEKAILGWQTRAHAALDGIGEAPAEPTSDSLGNPLLLQQIASLVRRTEEAQVREQQRPAVLDEQGVLNEKLAAAQREAAQAESRLAQLFDQVDASDRDDYLVKLSQFQALGELKATIRAREAELARRLGLGEEAESFQTQLALGRVAVWERDVVNADLEVVRLEERCDEVLREHQDARNEVQELEGSNGVGSLELNRATLEQELVEVVARWRVLQIARCLIERTLERFERERQPAVLQEASHYFSTVTGGRYPQIVQTAESGGFSVVDAAGGRKRPAELSRGTAEQLYVCIRLGLIAEFSRRVRRLPVAMDDVLVNFDDARALAMAGVLDEFSKRNACQVLVFTCSSRTKELFAKAAPVAAHFEIGAPVPVES
jgi:uncharacterized protein YhaN